MPPRIQEGDQTWSDLGEPLSISQWEEVISLLTPNKKKKPPFMGFISLKGEEKSLENVGFYFHPFQKSHQNASIFFKAPINLQKKLSPFPSSSILPLSSKPFPSLHFLIGPAHSGKSSFMLHRLQKLNQQAKLCVSILSDIPQYNLKSKHCMFHSLLWSDIKDQQDSFSSLTPWWEPSSLIIIDTPLEKNLLQQALLLAGQGKTLYWIVDSLSIESFLRQLRSLCVSSSHPLYSYLLSLTHSLTGQYAFFKSQGNLLFAHEVLIITKEVRENLLQEKGKSPFSFMEEGEKLKNGMQTLNQSLLQHLLTRRLSLKEAFQMSTDPENLNQLLENKGI